MEFDPVQLREALDRVNPGDWSQPSTYKATGAHHGYRRIVLVDHGRRLDAAGPWGFVLDKFDPVHTAWLSLIDSGGFIRLHRDKGPYQERWQVPIQTAGTFTHNGQTFAPTVGAAFQVRHWEPHAVDNPTTRARVHLVIDRDIWLDHPAEPFTLY